MVRQRNVDIIDPIPVGILETNILRWGALWGGLFVAVGIFLLLNMLGMAIGFGVLDPFHSETFRDVGIGAVVWAAIAQVVALFVGGIVAARQAGLVDRFTGMLHGVVLWGFVTVISMAFSVAVVGSAMSAGARMMGAGAEAMPGVVQEAGSALGIDSSVLVEPINDQLRAEGRPEITASQLEASIQAAAQRAVQEGRLDREIVVQSLSQHTALSRDDATTRRSSRVASSRRSRKRSAEPERPSSKSRMPRAQASGDSSSRASSVSSPHSEERRSASSRGPSAESIAT